MYVLRTFCTTCNMNVICVLIAIGVLKSVAADVVTTEANRTKFDNFIYRRCNQYSTDLVAYDNIKEHLDTFKSYLEVAFSRIPNEKSNFCDEKPNLIQLMRLTAKDIKPCLPKDEKYLPQFIYDSFVYFMQFLCDDNGKNLDNFFSTPSQECLGKLKQQAAGNEVSHCFKKISPPLDSVVTKDRLCGDIDMAKKCFSTTIAKHCPEMPAFESLNNRFFTAVHKPCNSSTWISGVSSLVLLASILIHKMLA